ncbi:MAG: Rrf2 family transcriptional regulator [Ruminococcus flavefaciens]|nr:Rrf2 family transcriptional regulator [Ruminococcus flavefaciens]MCM1230884.1 Rrf2 family transcriptional regulator [Ruminococcus flavefaciens]
MRISTRGQNAIKFMLDLAVYDNGEPVKLRDIARRQDISEKYLEQIVAVLQKASLVKSFKGSRGGYVLKYPPAEYTIGYILKTVEGDMSPAECVGENSIACEKSGICVYYRLWQKLYTAIDDVLEGITLADMLEWQNELWTDQYII